ncbi:hypothetical protein DIPPA_13566a, partial [Diplonema papillatum]
MTRQKKGKPGKGKNKGGGGGGGGGRAQQAPKKSKKAKAGKQQHAPKLVPNPRAAVFGALHFCEVCGIKSNSDKGFGIHLKSRRHKMNMGMFRKTGEVQIGKKRLAKLNMLTEGKSGSRQPKKSKFVKRRVGTHILADVVHRYADFWTSLINAEQAYASEQMMQRLTAWDSARLQAEGHLFTDCELKEMFVLMKATLRFPKKRKVATERLIGSVVCISGMHTPPHLIHPENVRACATGTITAVNHQSMTVALRQSTARFPATATGTYRVDVGPSTAIVQRIANALRKILDCYTLHIKSQKKLQQLESGVLGVDGVAEDHRFLEKDGKRLKIGKRPKTLDGEEMQEWEENKWQEKNIGLFMPDGGWAEIFFPEDMPVAIAEARHRIRDCVYEASDDEDSEGDEDAEEGTAQHWANEPADTEQQVRASWSALTREDLMARHSELNDAQLAALERVVVDEQRITLIQGPPGSGKTRTAVAIIKECVEKYSCSILATAHSEASVDAMLEEMTELGLKCVLVGNAENSAFSRLSLESLLRRLEGSTVEDDMARRTEFEKKLADSVDPRVKTALRHDLRILNELIAKPALRATPHRMLGVALSLVDVVCTTCLGAGSSVLEQSRFPIVVMDDANRVSEPAALCPLVKGAKLVVLAGDSCQLPPTVSCRGAWENGLAVSLFDRLIANYGIKPVTLSTQYERNPDVFSFSNEKFYNSRIESDAEDQTYGLPLVPVSFIHVNTPEQRQGPSCFNRGQVDVIHNLVSALNPDSGCSVAVLTPYTAQAMVLRHKLGKNVDIVTTIDEVLGAFDVVYLSLCRTADAPPNLGYLSDWRRVN